MGPEVFAEVFGSAGIAEPPEGWVARCAEAGIEFGEGELELLGRYLGLLMAMNGVMNLTAIRDADEAWDRHVFDGLTLLPILGEVEAGNGERLRVLDVGSGGGLPGMVLACVMPGAEFTLMDATSKKCAFLAACADELGLRNVRVVCGRAEQYGQDRGRRDGGAPGGRVGAFRESFDVVTARAVGRMAMLSELMVPFARVGGLCVLVKGEKAEEELVEAKGALHLLHAAHAGTVATPTGRVVVLEKLRGTPKAYPRRDGEPKRSPLGMSGAG